MSSSVLPEVSQETQEGRIVTKDSIPEPIYIRLRNLPFSACQKDIRWFFSGLSIVSGGISIHGNSAFVVFENEEEALSAMLLDTCHLHGSVIRVSMATFNDVQATWSQYTQRKLILSPKDNCPLTKGAGPSRRIRPTAVARRERFGLFRPFEVDESTETECPAGQGGSRVVRAKKTIRPTKVIALDKYKLLYH